MGRDSSSNENETNVRPLWIKKGLSLLALAFACLVIDVPRAFAGIEDCIEDGGLRQCVLPTLSDWRYSGCVSNNLIPTNTAVASCMVLNPGPWTTEGQMFAFAECMPVMQHNACSAQAGFQGWQGPGSSTNAYAATCGSLAVTTDTVTGLEMHGYGFMQPDVDYRDPQTGNCGNPGGYYTIVAERHRAWVCPDGYDQQVVIGGVRKCKMNSRAPAPSCCNTSGPNNFGGVAIGNPINVGSWEKFQTETDYEGPTLKFVRTFYSFGGFAPNNGQTYPSTALGLKWTHTYDRRIYPYAGNAYLMAAALRPNGFVRHFKLDGLELLKLGPSALLQPQYSGATLTGWRLVTNDHEIEEYDASGRLLSISTRGAVQTMTYSDGSTPPSVAPGPGYLITVTDHAARTLNFTYNASGRLVKMTDPAGKDYVYAYDEASSILQAGEAPAGDLTSVTYPSTGGSTPKRIYHYNESSYFTPTPVTGTTIYPHMLTGVTGEDGQRYSRFWYSSAKKAYRSQTWNNFDRYEANLSSSTSAPITNPLGSWRSYQFNNPSSFTGSLVAGTTKLSATYQPCQTPGCSGNAIAQISYDSNGFVSRMDDFNLNRTHYSWNTARQLETQRIEGRHTGGNTPVTRTIDTQWHSTFNLPTLITESGRTTAFTYDSNGNVLTRTITDTALSKARTWTYTYNSDGQVLTVNGPRTDVSDVTTYGYTSGNLTSITNPLSQVTYITSHDAHGRPLTIMDPNGLTTAIAYNDRGWVTSRTSGGETTTFDYDNLGQTTKVTLPDASFLQYTYNPARKLTEIADNQGNRIVYTLDNMGNRTQEDVRDPSNNLAQTRTRIFNILGRLTQEIGGTNPVTQITTHGYDNQGNLKTLTDPLSQVTTNSYDQLNRLTQITAPGSNVTKYAYNARDQLTSVTDPRNNVTTYTVNALDDVTQQVSPDTGTTVMTYDAAGNLLTSRDAKLQTTTYTYDALNRVLDATFHDGSKVEYGYDAGTNGIGHLTSITEKAPGGAVVTSTTYTYNAHGRLLTDTRVISTVSYVTTYGYDSAGRLNSVTYPSGRQLLYTFDSVGRVSGINTVPPGGGSPQAVVSSVTYHPFGGVKGFTYGNSQAYSRTYDLDGRIAGFTLPGQSHTVSFDAASRITGATFLPNPAQSITYGYDNLDRLTSAVTPLTTFGYGYDANANRTSKTVGGNTQTYAYPGTSNKLTSITGGGSWTYTHDANGSITNDGTNTFTYDTRGRLIGAATALGAVTYGLNALGQRYAKTVGGVSTIFHYDQGGTLIGETDAAGVTLTEYVHLGDVPVALFR